MKKKTYWRKDVTYGFFSAITYPKRTNLTGQDLWQGANSSVIQDMSVQEQRK